MDEPSGKPKVTMRLNEEIGCRPPYRRLTVFLLAMVLVAMIASLAVAAGIRFMIDRDHNALHDRQLGTELEMVRLGNNIADLARTVAEAEPSFYIDTVIDHNWYPYVVHDTVIVYDTLIVEKIVIVRDTLAVTDTVYAQLPADSIFMSHEWYKPQLSDLGWTLGGAVIGYAACWAYWEAGYAR